MKIKYVVIIQCEIAQRRCSGFACTNAFYDRKGKFKDYNEDVKYISFTCGGCCGKGVSSKLEHLCKKMISKKNIKPEEIKVHLSTCMVTDNHHYDRCPHIDYIKNIILKRGFDDIIEGSFIDDVSEFKREKDIYKTY